MYVGHLGIALGAHSVRRSVALWLLIVAAQFPDWLDAGFCSLTGDRGPHALYTHGFLAIAAGILVLAGLYALKSRDLLGGLLVAGIIVSHYLVDLLTGRKPTWEGGPVIGLGLYSKPGIELVLEGVVILLGWWLYRRSVPESHRNAWQVYAILLTLTLFQTAAGILFYFDAAGQLKC